MIGASEGFGLGAGQPQGVEESEPSGYCRGKMVRSQGGGGGSRLSGCPAPSEWPRMRGEMRG